MAFAILINIRSFTSTLSRNFIVEKRRSIKNFFSWSLFHVFNITLEDLVMSDQFLFVVLQIFSNGLVQVLWNHHKKRGVHQFGISGLSVPHNEVNMVSMI
jgi:hypothetical protein